MMRIFIVLLSLLSLTSAISVYQGWQLKQVDRQISLQTQNVRHFVRLVARNGGEQEASTLHLTLPSELSSHLASVQAFQDDKEIAVEAKGEENEIAYYAVKLRTSVAPKGQATVNIGYTFTHLQKPYPTHISQNEVQLVTYTDSHYFYSPYTVRSQKTTLSLPSNFVESFSQDVEPVEHKGQIITYGPYEEIQPFKQVPLHVHFENNSPFLSITKLIREIEISHWGNVAVTEEIFMQNDGPKLQGTFSRFDFQRNSRPPSAIRSVTHLLPLLSSDIYYRDEIGNISTSVVTPAEERLAVELIPRFPLFGGWKTRFTLGYNLPLSRYVFHDPSDSSALVLNTTFSEELTTDFVIDELTIRVILPEGSKNAHFKLPFPVDGQETDVRLTYLDVMGRPVVVVHKKNVVIDHNKHFQVIYHFASSSMLLEPLLLVIFYFILMVSAIIYMRFELSISKEKYLTAKEEKQMRIRELLGRIRDIHNEFTNQTDKMMSNPAKSSQKKKVDLLGQLQKIETELEPLNAGLATKLKSFNQKWKKKRGLVDEFTQNEVAGQEKKINTKAYESKKMKLKQDLEATGDELDGLLAELLDE